MTRIPRPLAFAFALLINASSLLGASAPGPVWLDPTGQSDPTGQTDRTAEYEANLRTHVRRNEFLATLEFEWVWDYAPYVVVVQRPKFMAEGYVEKAAKLNVGESLEMHTRFKQGMANELALSMRSSSPRMIVLVLENQETLTHYLEVRMRQKMGGWASYYDAGDRILALCEKPLGNKARAQGASRLDERRFRALQILQAYSPRSDLLPGPYWFQEGLARELAGLNNRDLTREIFGKSTGWSFNDVCAAIQNPALARMALPSLFQILTAEGYPDLWREASVRVHPAKLSGADGLLIAGTFQAAAGALIQFLTLHAGADLSARMRAFTEGAMKGQLGKNSFGTHFKGVDWSEVERDFWTYVWERWEAENSIGDADRAGLERLLARTDPQAGEGEVAVAKPKTLLDVPEGSDAQLAIAIALMLAGDPEGALERLTAAIEVEPDPKLRARLKVEQMRIEAWRAQRDAYLQFLADGNDKLSLKLSGKKLLAVVEKVEGDLVLLGKNNRDIGSLPLVGLDPIQLAGRMNGSSSDFPAGWAVAYPGAVDPATRSKRWLVGEDLELNQLAADVKDDYKDRTESIEAAKHLVALTIDPALAIYDPSELTALEHLKALWASRSEVDWVSTLADGLPRQAERLLGKQFDDKPTSDYLSVPFHPDSERMVELHYDFSDPAQLADWPLDPDASLDHNRYPATTVAEPYLRIQAGHLEGAGFLSRTHVLALSGVQSIRWKMKTLSGGKASSDTNATVRVSLCADAGGSYAGVFHIMDLEVMDGVTRDFGYTTATGFGNRFDTQYDRELRHDGKTTITGYSNGKEIVSAPCRNRLVGCAQIMLHSDYVIELDEIVIRGQLTEDSFDVLRQAWIAKGLVELGLAE